MFSVMPKLPLIEHFSSVYQKMDLVFYPSYTKSYAEALRKAYSAKYERDPFFQRNYRFFLNRHFQFGSYYEEIYHEYLAHVPIHLNGSIPHNILVLGAGDGFLVRELIKYSEVDSITLIDLDKKNDRIS